MIFNYTYFNLVTLKSYTNVFVKVLIKSSIKKKVGKKKIQATRYLAVHILHHYLNLSPAVMIAI